jgi:hypothetical protein
VVACLHVISKNLWRGREHALFDGLTFATRDLAEALDGRLEAIAAGKATSTDNGVKINEREGCFDMRDFPRRILGLALLRSPNFCPTVKREAGAPSPSPEVLNYRYLNHLFNVSRSARQIHKQRKVDRPHMPPVKNGGV